MLGLIFECKDHSCLCIIVTVHCKHNSNRHSFLKERKMKKILNTLFPLITMVAISGVCYADNNHLQNGAALQVDRQERDRIFEEARQNLAQIELLPLEQQVVALGVFVINARNAGPEFINEIVANLGENRLDRLNEVSRIVALPQQEQSQAFRGHILEAIEELNGMNHRNQLETNLLHHLVDSLPLALTRQDLRILVEHLMAECNEIDFAERNHQLRRIEAPMRNEGAAFIVLDAEPLDDPDQPNI